MADMDQQNEYHFPARSQGTWTNWNAPDS